MSREWYTGTWDQKVNFIVLDGHVGKVNSGGDLRPVPYHRETQSHGSASGQKWHVLATVAACMSLQCKGVVVVQVSSDYRMQCC